jgi:phage terminase small subunit
VAGDAAILAVERVQTELARLCFSDIRNVFHEDGSPKPLRELDDDTVAAIERYEIRESVVGGQVVGRTIRVKFWDKNAAIGMAARHLGLFENDYAQTKQDIHVRVELVG